MTIQGGRVHLIVLIHGLYGNPTNLAVVKEELERAYSRDRKDEEEVENLLDSTSSSCSKSKYGRDDLELRVLVCKSFTGSHTWDGIDVNTHKAAGEVDAEIERIQGEGKVVVVFSIVRLKS